MKSDEIGQVISNLTKDANREMNGKTKSIYYYIIRKGLPEKFDKFEISDDEAFEWANSDYNVNKYLKTLKIDPVRGYTATQLTKDNDDEFLDEVGKEKFNKDEMIEKLYVEMEKFVRERAKKNGQLELDLKECYETANKFLI